MVDTAFVPVFQYFDIVEASCGLSAVSISECRAWQHAFSGRTPVMEAVKSEYPDRLAKFLISRNSHISVMVGR
jgi:hypothetical protein